MDNQPNEKKSGCQGLMWWATLTVAVLAVPAFGFVVVTASKTTGLLQLVIFVLACWLCTFLGMKLMHLPGMSHTIYRPKDQ